MKRLFYVLHEYGTKVPFRTAKLVCNEMGGQYFSSVYPTRLQPKIPQGFVFRSEEEARAFEAEIQRLMLVDEELEVEEVKP